MKLNKEIKKDSYAIKLTLEEDESTQGGSDLVGDIVGHAYLYIIFNDLHKKPYGLLEDLYVEEKFRSQGAGTELLKQVISVARENNCYKLLANSRTEREAIHAWYLKNGFSEYGKEFRINFD